MTSQLIKTKNLELIKPIFTFLHLCMTCCFLRKLYSFLNKLSIISFYNSALYCSLMLLSLLQSLSIAFHLFTFVTFYSLLYPFFLSIFNWPILYHLFFILCLFYHPLFLTFHNFFHHFFSSYSTNLSCVASCSWNTSCIISLSLHSTLFCVSSLSYHILSCGCCWHSFHSRLF